MSRRDRWILAGTLLGLWGALLSIQLRILTYVTGQDPFTYVRCARTLLDGRFGFAAWREVSGFIAPGYPALLAVVLAVAGPYAVAWINFALLAGLFWILACLVRRWGVEGWGGLVAGWALLWLTLRGYPLNAHFLFYAFRGAPQLLMVAGAWLLVDGARPESRWGGPRLALATVVLALASLVRETAILAWPGLAWWVCANAAWRGRRVRGLLWLAAPGFVGGLMLGALALAGAIPDGGHYQARLWVGRLLADDWRAILSRLARYMAMLRSEAGWAGAALFALGAWRLRRRLDVLGLLIAPAAAWILFYAVYRVHARFLLDAYFLLCLVGGAGAWHAADLVRLRVKPSWRGGVTAVAAAVMAWLVVSEVGDLVLWGPRVGRTRLRRLCADVERLVGPGEVLMVAPSSVFLIEALDVFAGRPMLYAMHETGNVFAERSVVYARPESGMRQRRPGIDPDDWLAQHAALIPVGVTIPEAGEGGATLELGSERFSLWRAVPWAEPRVEQALGPEHVVGGLMWLDFRATDPHAARDVRLVGGGGDPIRAWRVARGNGLMPFFVGTAYVAGARVEVTSTGGLPTELLAVPESWDGVGYFTLGDRRKPSVMQWIEPPTHRARPTDKWGAVFELDAAFDVPLPVGQTGGVAVVSVALEPRFKRARSAGFAYSAGGVAMQVFTNRMDEAVIRHDLRITMPAPGSRLSLRLHVNVEGPLENHFRVLALGVGAVPAADAP